MTLIFHTLFVCVVAVGASDDQSLMQQGVGIESGVLEGATQSQFKQNLAIVTSALREIPYPGKMRQMAIEALVKSVSKAEKLTPGNTDLLNQIKALLVDMLTYLGDEKTVGQAALDAYKAAFTACNDAAPGSPTTAAVALLEGAKVASDTAHSDCRAEQVTTTQNAQTDCANLIIFLAALTHNPSECDAVTWSEQWKGHRSEVHNKVDYEGALYTTDIGGIAVTNVLISDDSIKNAYTAWLNGAKVYFSGLVSSYAGLLPACETAHTANQDKANACDLLQTQFEADFCTWHAEQLVLCALRTSCFATKQGEYNAEWAAQHPVGTERVNVAGVIEHVNCLIDKLEADEAFATGDCPIVCATCDADYNVHEPTLDSENACPAPPTFTPTDTADFYAQEYQAMQDAIAAANTGAAAVHDIPNPSACA